MKIKIFILIQLLLLAYQAVTGQETPVEKGLRAITPDVITAQMGFLASDWMEGREAGEKGEYLAGDYIASMLQLYGVKPGGDNPRIRGYMQSQQASGRTYFQNITLLKTTPGDEQTLKLKTIEGSAITTTSFESNIDFFIRSQEKSIEKEAPVIFAGYGFKNDKLKYNDFRSLDVKGKFILKISGVPGFAREKLTPEELSASARETENMLRNSGAAGIIEFNLSTTTVGTQPLPAFLNMAPSESRQWPGGRYARYTIPGTTDREEVTRILISERAARQILRGTSTKLDEYLKNAESGKPGTFPALTSRTIYVRSNVITAAVQVRNVIGIIEGNDPDQIIVIGAHYDHEGIANGYIWNGADDNASGTVGVLTLAKAIMETGIKPEKTIIIALWTAEEKGLLGSRYYVDNLVFPLENLRLNVNFDMISRYVSDDQPEMVTMTYTSRCPEFRELTENNLLKHGIKLKIVYEASSDPPGGSDHRSFVAKGVPVMRFKPGHREEYHTPDDEISTVDWDIMEKIIRISFANVWELANSEW
ncbi:MAG: M20/M25/M40 family metallo-hydrolase [Bacteroidota bacterium]